MKRTSAGFTLIEIMVATTIIAVLSVIGIVSYNSVNKRSRDAKRKSDLEQVRSALEMYRADNGSYPGTSATFITLTTLDAGNGTGPLVPSYLPSIPMDPKSRTTTPIPYYYSPTGNGPPYYSYCLCGGVESDSGKNDCAVTGTSPPVGIIRSAYCLRNP